MSRMRPEVFVLQWDGRQSYKSFASFAYPLQLSLGKYCTEDALADGWGEAYTLGGVVLHHGSTVQAGHYTLLYKQPDGKWLLFNDAERPQERSERQVMDNRELVCGLIYYRAPLHR